MHYDDQDVVVVYTLVNKFFFEGFEGIFRFEGIEVFEGFEGIEGFEVIKGFEGFVRYFKDSESATSIM